MRYFIICAFCYYISLLLMNENNSVCETKHVLYFLVLVSVQRDILDEKYISVFVPKQSIRWTSHGANVGKVPIVNTHLKTNILKVFAYEGFFKYFR